MIFEYSEPDKDPYSERELVVTFRFNSDVNVDEAIKQIDTLVSLADNNDDIQFNSHEFDLYVIGEEE